ncbi:hypothetical protein Tco_0618500 [Tanacetum coccineum]
MCRGQEAIDDCRVLSNRKSLKNRARTIELEGRGVYHLLVILSGSMRLDLMFVQRMGEVTFQALLTWSEAVRMAHKLMEQKSQARDERILEGNKQKWESFQRAAYQWFTRECMGSITNWDNMVEKFILKFHHLSDHDDEEIEEDDNPSATENIPEIFNIEGNIFDFETLHCDEAFYGINTFQNFKTL